MTILVLIHLAFAWGGLALSTWSAARRFWVADVKVGCATTALECDWATVRVGNSILRDRAGTMLSAACVLLGDLDVTVQVSALVPDLALMLDSLPLLSLDFITERILIPLTIIIDDNANVIALEVHHLTVLAVAIFRAAHLQELVLARGFEQHVDIAFDLLSGGPVNLAILLLAFASWHHLVIRLLALVPACVVDSIAIAPLVLVIPAICGLAL
jgi:hypothetical protein